MHARIATGIFLIAIAGLMLSVTPTITQSAGAEQGRRCQMVNGRRVCTYPARCRWGA